MNYPNVDWEQSVEAISEELGEEQGGYLMTTARKLFKKFEERGIEKGKANILYKLLKLKFGELEPEIENLVNSCKEPAKLEKAAAAIINPKISLAEMIKLLR